MSIFRTITRCAETAIKLPFSVAWDIASLGNMGDGASTSKVLREHEQRKQIDDFRDALEIVQEINKRKRT